MSTKLWIGDKVFIVEDEVNDLIAQLTAELEAKNKYSAGIHARLIVSDNELTRVNREVEKLRFELEAVVEQNKLTHADLEAARMEQGIQWISVKDKDKLPKRVHPDYDQSEQILILWNRGVCCGIYRPDAAMFEVPCATIPDEDYQNEITHFAEINLPEQGKEGSEK